MQRETFTAEWQPRILSVLRIMVALILLQHPLVKFFAFPVAFPFPLSPIFLAAGGIELVCGVLLLLGLFTRPAALLFSGEMAVAYFMFRPSRGFFPIVNGGELEIVLCFVALYLAFAGGGAWSVDAARKPGYSPALSAR